MVLAIAVASTAVIQALTDTTIVGATNIAGPRGIVAASYALAGLALTRRRTEPVAVAITAIGVLAIPFAAFGASEGFGSLAPVLVALYSVGAHRERRTATAALALFGGFWAFFELRDPLNHDLHDAVGSWPILLLGVIVWLGGIYLRTRRLYLAELDDRAEERVRTATAQERTRIARELHDAVAHAMSVMVIQAEGADELLTRDPERARVALGRIQDTGRNGLSEMRRLLDVLRQDEATALAPQRGIPALEPLVADVCAAGLPVELTVIGTPRSVSAGVDISAYRIVQEALTNAMKHACASAVSVHVRYGEQLELEVSDDGVGVVGRSADGHGLLGMRERAALFGGTLDAGPAAGGGFRVRATLPIEAET
jgi:signal transduction histidine kinase